MQKQIFVRTSHSKPVSQEDLKYIAESVTAFPETCIRISQNLWQSFISAILNGKQSPEPLLINFFDPRSSDIHPQEDQVVGVLFGRKVFVGSDDKFIEILKLVKEHGS